MTITGDNPIRRVEDDALGRANLARFFVQQVLALDATEGVVVGVLGPWGSGKTSFINLARHKFVEADVSVLDFNPWMFSGTEQLVESFFLELAAQLKVRTDLVQVGKNLQKYGEMFSGMAWLPLIGPWIKGGSDAAKALGDVLQRRKEGIGGRRDKLKKTLSKLGKPIVVVLDDIDRLSTTEIRSIFTLVRLTASFPNIVYILAFDRVRIEQALSEQGYPGRDYLEKILQVAFDVPEVPSQVLSQIIFAAVDSALADIKDPGPFDKQVWPDVFMEIIRPLIRNMRDVRRYTAAAYGTVSALGGKIALADVLSLEAIRVLLPNVFGRLHLAIEGLITTSGELYGGHGDMPHLKTQIDDLIKAGGEHEGVVRAMIERLFPAGLRHIGGSSYGRDWVGQWFQKRRVAHGEILRLYLERVASEGLKAMADAEQALTLLADREALDGYLRSLDAARLQDVIESLLTFEDEFAPEHVVPGTIVLLNLLPDLPKRQRGIFDLDTRLVVTRVTYRFLRSLGDPAAVEAAVRQILPELKSLSAKLEVISDVGYRERVGHKMVSEIAAAEFERAWRDEVRSKPVVELANEDNLVRILLTAKRESTPSEDLLNLQTSTQLTLAVLRSSQSEILSQPMGSRAIARSPQLAWDALVELYGDEATLRERIESLKAARPVGADELLELADKYLGGWQPEDLNRGG